MTTAAAAAGGGCGSREEKSSGVNEELAATGKIALSGAERFGCSSVTPTPGLNLSLPQEYAITPALHSGEPSGELGAGSGSFNNTNGTTKELL